MFDFEIHRDKAYIPEFRFVRISVSVLSVSSASFLAFVFRFVSFLSAIRYMS
jgi:hypothetical protein